MAGRQCTEIVAYLIALPRGALEHDAARAILAGAAALRRAENVARGVDQQFSEGIDAIRAVRFGAKILEKGCLPRTRGQFVHLASAIGSAAACRAEQGSVRVCHDGV